MSRSSRHRLRRTAVLLAATLAGALGATAALADPSFDGTWSSSTFGAMILSDKGDQVVGRYDFKGGRLQGHMDGRTLDGVWAQDTAAQGCHDQRMGSFYWGRMRLTLDDHGQGFHGVWGYCDNPPTSDWHGQR